MFIVGVDLGQAQDYTAISIIERLEGTPDPHYHLRYLERPPLGTSYPAIVSKVLGLLATPPLTRAVPLVVDKTGVGAAVVDLFTAAGVRPRAVTITGGMDVNREDPFDLKVPKRELASVLVALYQSRRLLVAEGLDLAQLLVTELLNFKVKINIATGHESFEAWRESIHDDLVLATALSCWYGEEWRPLQIFFAHDDDPLPHTPMRPAVQALGWDEAGWHKGGQIVDGITPLRPR
jgi:hypothetical protein